MSQPTRNALIEGVADAAGFLAGAIAGTLLGRLLGWDFLGEAGYSWRVIAGIALVGLGGGLGVKLARLSVRREARKNKDDNSSR